MHMRPHIQVSAIGYAPFASALPKPTEPTYACANTLNVGLKIMEYLSLCQTPKTQSIIAHELALPPMDVHESMRILEQRGYISLAGAHGAYKLTSSLSQVKAETKPYHHLLKHASTVMSSLAEAIFQSCNLSIPTAGQTKTTPVMQVLSQKESSGVMGIHVPVGFCYDAPNAAPNVVCAAFSKGLGFFPAPIEQGDEAVHTHLAVQRTIENDFARSINPHFPDIIDLSCPVYSGTQFIAALSVPFFKTSQSSDETSCLQALKTAAEDLNTLMRRDSLLASND